MTEHDASDISLTEQTLEEAIIGLREKIPDKKIVTCTLPCQIAFCCVESPKSTLYNTKDICFIWSSNNLNNSNSKQFIHPLYCWTFIAMIHINNSEKRFSISSDCWKRLTILSKKIIFYRVDEFNIHVRRYSTLSIHTSTWWLKVSTKTWLKNWQKEGSKFVVEASKMFGTIDIKYPCYRRLRC